MEAVVCNLIRMQPPILVDRGLLSLSGATVPTDGTDGFQPGCIFQHTDGGNNTAFYINEGSVTSCEFNAVTTGGPADVLVIGAFSSVTQGSGIPISSSQTGAVKVYSDDVGASIGASVRGLLSRFLLTADQTGGSIRALMGQLKFANLIDVTSGVYTANQGYVEIAGTSIAKTGSKLSCFDASFEVTTAFTVNSGGLAAGIHVETTGAGSITVDATGTMAGIVITKGGTPNWPIGLHIVGPNSTEGIRVGQFVSAASGGGIVLATAVTAANRFYSDDGGAAIVNTGVNDTRGVLSRTLVTTDHSANELRLFALEGQLKGYNATWDNEMVAGVYGYLELVNTGSTTFDGYGFTAGVMSCVENSGAMIIGTNHVLSGFCAVSKITTDLTATGKTAAFHAGIYDNTNWSSTGEGALAWEYGLFVQDGATGIGIHVGTCTTGINIGTCTTAIAVKDVITISPESTNETLLDFILATEWTYGTLINAAYAGSTTFGGSVVGINLDFGTNIVATSEKSVKAIDITLPQATNDAASPALIGVEISASGAMTSTTSGGPTFTGISITTPNIDCTADTIVSTGISITTGTSVQTGGASTTTGVLVTGGTLTTGSVYGVTVAGNTTTALSVTGTCATGLAVSSSATLGFDVDAKSRVGTHNWGAASGIAPVAGASGGIFEAGASIATDITAGAYSAVYANMAITSSLQYDVSTFGGWHELYFSGDLTIGLANHAATWSVLEMADSGGALTFNAIGQQPTYNATWLAGHAIVFNSPDGFALGAGRHAAGLFIQSKIAASYSQNANAKFAAILINVDSLGGGPYYEPWPVGLEIMNNAATTGIVIGTCTTGIKIAGTIANDAILVGASGTPLVYPLSATQNTCVSIYADLTDPGTDKFFRGLYVRTRYMPSDTEGGASVYGIRGHVLTVATYDNVGVDENICGVHGYVTGIADALINDNGITISGIKGELGGSGAGWDVKIACAIEAKVCLTALPGSTANAYTGVSVYAPTSDATPLDCAMYVWGYVQGGIDLRGTVTDSLDWLFGIPSAAAAVTATYTTPLHGGTCKKIVIKIDGTDYYLLASTVPTD